MNQENKWQSVPCGVPGYDLTALAYAHIIRNYANEGKFVFALLYLEAAQKADVLHRMELALKE